MATDDVSDAIEESAQGPKKAVVDGVTVEQHDLADQVVADRYLRSKEAASTGLGVRRVVTKSPGAV